MIELEIRVDAKDWPLVLAAGDAGKSLGKRRASEEAARLAAVSFADEKLKTYIPSLKLWHIANTVWFVVAIIWLGISSQSTGNDLSAAAFFIIWANCGVIALCVSGLRSSKRSHLRRAMRVQFIEEFDKARAKGNKK